MSLVIDHGLSDALHAAAQQLKTLQLYVEEMTRHLLIIYEEASAFDRPSDRLKSIKDRVAVLLEEHEITWEIME